MVLKKMDAKTLVEVDAYEKKKKTMCGPLGLV